MFVWKMSGKCCLMYGNSFASTSVSETLILSFYPFFFLLTACPISGKALGAAGTSHLGWGNEGWLASSTRLKEEMKQASGISCAKFGLC